MQIVVANVGIAIAANVSMLAPRRALEQPRPGHLLMRTIAIATQGPPTPGSPCRR
jgi:hypothetical protein